VLGHWVLMYFMNSGTHKFFGTITFRIRYIFVACMGLYKFARLIAFITLYLVIVNILNILYFFGLVDKYVNNYRGRYKYCGLHKGCVTLRVLSLSLHPFFRFNYWKSNRSIRRAFTIEVFECLLKQAYYASHVNLQGVQLL